MTFPTTLDSDFGTIVDNVDATAASQLNELRRAIEGIETKIGIDSSLVTTSLDYLVNSFFESGRRMWLYEDAAPTGWTYMASIADRVIAVKGGSNAFNVVGGNQAGTWTQLNHTHTGPSHTHTTSRTTFYQPGYHESTMDVTTCTVTGSGGTGTTSNGAPANSWRPYGAVGIIVEKD